MQFNWIILNYNIKLYYFAVTVQHVNEAENETQRMKKTNLPVYFVCVQLSYNIYIVWEGCRLEHNKRIYYYYY